MRKIIIYQPDGFFLLLATCKNNLVISGTLFIASSLIQFSQHLRQVLTRNEKMIA